MMRTFWFTVLSLLVAVTASAQTPKPSVPTPSPEKPPPVVKPREAEPAPVYPPAAQPIDPTQKALPTPQYKPPVAGPDTQPPLPQPLPPGTPHAATYAERSIMSYDGVFNGRVAMASMAVVLAVFAESPATSQHDLRMKFAGNVLRESEFATRKLARLLAMAVPANVDAQGRVSTPISDAGLQAVLAERWTLLAQTMGQQF